MDLDRIARRRAGAKLGFYIHATVFVIVNLAGADWRGLGNSIKGD